MGGEKLVDDATRRRKKGFDTAFMMAKDHSMFAYAQTRHAFKIAMQDFDITAPVYQTKDGSLHPAPGLGSKCPLVHSHLLRDGYFSRQGMRQGGTSACRI